MPNGQMSATPVQHRVVIPRTETVFGTSSFGRENN